MLSGITSRTTTLPMAAPKPLPTRSEAPAPVDTATLSSAPAPTSPKVAAHAAAAALGAAARSIGGAIGGALSAWNTGVKFLGYGALYKFETAITERKEKIHHPLEGLPTPQIDRPFVMVPGWTTETDAFAPLVEHLTKNGANGGQAYFVKQGQIYTMDAHGSLQPCPKVPTDARVFEMVFSDNRQSPTRNQPEMRANFDAITKATGVTEFDAEGYSMGGIDSRLYLDQGGKAIHRLMLLGTPNRGTHFADLAKDVIQKKVGWAEKFGGLQPADDLDSLTWLQPEDVSAPLHDLNSRWDSQRKAAPILTVGTDVMPTPSRNVFGLTNGDGLVPASSLAMPKGDTIVLNEAMHHGSLNDDETVEHIRDIYFGWGLPVNANAAFPAGDKDIVAGVSSPATP